MNRGELIRLTSRKLGRRPFVKPPREDGTVDPNDRLSTAESADKVLAALCEVIALAVASDEKVMIRDFGTFEPRNRAATRRRHPQTGEMIEVPARRTVVFTPSDRLRDRLNDN